MCRHIDSSCVFAGFVGCFWLVWFAVVWPLASGLGCFMLSDLVGCLWAFRGVGLVFCGFDVLGLLLLID